MGYLMPSDEQLIDALRIALKKAHTVDSQTLLRQLVKQEINTTSKEYGVNAQRLRKIAIDCPFVSIDIQSRKGDPKKYLSHCPVCETPLKKVKNLTIWGGEVTIQLRCPTCGYWTGKQKRVPIRYIFHYVPQEIL